MAHIITGLETGGAETMLLKLIRATKSDVEHSVISLRGKGTIGPQIEACGVPVNTCGIGGLRQSVPALRRIVDRLTLTDPDVLQGWMYHGNAMANVANLMTGNRWPVAWAIRTTFKRKHTSIGSQVVAYCGMPLSYGADTIFYNSDLARSEHERFGYAKRGMVLPNGFDVDFFRPDAGRRDERRRELGIPSEAFVVGYVGRLAPVKDLSTFFSAAAQMARVRDNAMFVALGRDMKAARELLPDAVPDIDFLGDRLKLLPETANVLCDYNAFDALALSSLAESFPNVLGEAMSCGLPCVATDVGSCRQIIGETGYVVPIRDSKAMAKAMTSLIDMPADRRQDLGARARAKIVERFSLSAVAEMHKAAWLNLASKRKGTS